MALSEDELCELFADGIKDSRTFADWLISRTKFSPHVSKCRLLHEEQASIRPRKRWWRHWWCHVPELAKDRETDIFMVFQPESVGERFALHIECKKDNYRFNDGQAAAYAPRAKHMLTKPEFLGHSDFTTILLAPETFRARFPDKASLFDVFIAFDDVARFLPAFTTEKSARSDTDAYFAEQAARADIPQALDTPSRAGRGIRLIRTTRSSIVEL